MYEYERFEDRQEIEKDLIKTYQKICENNPTAKKTIHRILADLLSVTDQEAAQLQRLFKEYIEKAEK